MSAINGILLLKKEKVNQSQSTTEYQDALEQVKRVIAPGLLILARIF